MNSKRNGIDMKAKFPWEKRKIGYSEWGIMDFDWNNYYKITNSVESYLWRKDNYEKGKDNEHILKSTFGKAYIEDIEKEIQWWFDKCIGAYNQIKYESNTSTTLEIKE